MRQTVDTEVQAGVDDEKGRGRSKSEEKRRQIIAAAGDLFIEQGYENASMVGIAKSAGVSKQTLYSHFGSKELLFSAAIESKCEEFQLSKDLNTERRDRTCRESLEEFALHFSQLLVSNEAIMLFKVCIAESGRSNVGQLFWQAGPERIREQLYNYLKQQHDSGELCIPDISLACSQLIAMLHGEAHSCALLGQTTSATGKDLRRYSRACVDMFLKAYKAD